MSDPKTAMLFVRVTPAFAADFQTWAEQYGSMSDVIRELCEAAVEKRLIIKPNPKKPAMEKLFQ